MTILIAEDDATTRWALAALLREEGHRAVVVTSGRAAVAAFDEVDPEVVILDYGLPDMSGLDVLEEISPASGRPRALLVTGQCLSPRVRGAAEDLGARILTKPVSPPALLNYVRGAGGDLA